MRNRENFGLGGMQDSFLGLGKKAKKRKAERRARKKARKETNLEKKRLKNDERRADIEAKRTQTSIMQSTILPSGEPSSTSDPEQPPTSPNQWLGGNTLIIAIGGIAVLFLLMNNKKQSPPNQVKS